MLRLLSLFIMSNPTSIGTDCSFPIEPTIVISAIAASAHQITRDANVACQFFHLNSKHHRHRQRSATHLQSSHVIHTLRIRNNETTTSISPARPPSLYRSSNNAPHHSAHPSVSGVVITRFEREPPNAPAPAPWKWLLGSSWAAWWLLGRQIRTWKDARKCMEGAGKLG